MPGAAFAHRTECRSFWCGGLALPCLALTTMLANVAALRCPATTEICMIFSALTNKTGQTVFQLDSNGK
jgi:hypothetical protein